MNLAPDVTLAQLAKVRGMPTRKLWRLLIRLHGRDRGEQKHGWLYRCNRHWRVNIGAMRAAHPELFDVPNPADVETRVAVCETELRALKKRINGLYSLLKAAAVDA